MVDKSHENYHNFRTRNNRLFSMCKNAKILTWVSLICIPIVGSMLDNYPLVSKISVAYASAWFLCECAFMYHFRIHYDVMKDYINKSFQAATNNSNVEVKLTALSNWFFDISLKYLCYITGAYWLTLL